MNRRSFIQRTSAAISGTVASFYAPMVLVEGEGGNVPVKVDWKDVIDKMWEDRLSAFKERDFLKGDGNVG